MESTLSITGMAAAQRSARSKRYRWYRGESTRRVNGNEESRCLSIQLRPWATGETGGTALATEWWYCCCWRGFPVIPAGDGSVPAISWWAGQSDETVSVCASVWALPPIGRNCLGRSASPAKSPGPVTASYCAILFVHSLSLAAKILNILSVDGVTQNCQNSCTCWRSSRSLWFFQFIYQNGKILIMKSWKYPMEP